jgi:ACS family hexuronate transporter-like MFS transporter
MIELSEPAAGLRAWMVTMMLLLSMSLNFIDRLVLANVAPSLQTQLHFSNTQYSYIVFAFLLGMTIGQLPAGMIIDWIGARSALPGLLTGWSVTNLLHALAGGVASLCGLRFIMGLFECGNYSSAMKVIGGLFPARQRALALALMDSGSLLGSIVAPPLVVFILTRYGWRAAFLIPSLLGLLWIYPWLKTYQSPRAAQQAGAPRLQNGPSLRSLLRCRQTWGVVLMRMFSGSITQFYWYWLPLYLVRGRGTSLSIMAALSSFSFLLGGAGNLAGGFWSGWMIRRGLGIDASRKIVFSTGALLAAASVLVPLIPSIRIAIALVALAIFGLNFTSCNLIAVVGDIFPETALARVTGLTGVGEGIMNMALTLATGIVVDRFSFAPVFAGAGIMPLLSMGAMFLVVGRIRPISFESEGVGIEAR